MPTLIEDDFNNLLTIWMEKNKVWRFEGESGIENFTLITKALGYSDLESFLSDNSGALTAMVTFIRENGEYVDDWKSSLKKELK